LAAGAEPDVSCFLRGWPRVAQGARPTSLPTRGSGAARNRSAVEAALSATWPEPPRTLKVRRTITFDENGNTASSTAPTRGNAPSGVGKVDQLTVYDRSGKVVKRFVKGPHSVWTIEP